MRTDYRGGALGSVHTALTHLVLIVAMWRMGSERLRDPARVTQHRIQDPSLEFMTLPPGVSVNLGLGQCPLPRGVTLCPLLTTRGGVTGAHPAASEFGFGSRESTSLWLYLMEQPPSPHC